MSLRPCSAYMNRCGSAALSAFVLLICAAVSFASPPASAPVKTGRSASTPRAARPAARGVQQSPAELARNARILEEAGAYTRAAETLRQLRGRVARDADLDLALAIDEARAGRLDSARVLLWGPTLTAALADSMPVSRRHEYAWQREGLFLNGQFDGWYWYVARARFEVAAALGRWNDAHRAAREAVAARPLAGKEWLALALSAARDGAEDEMRLAAGNAVRLDPALPEAHYVAGLLEWRAGRRAAALERFRAAVELDSSYREAALALVRSRLPGSSPDSLPAALLTGAREAGLLTSATRPKLEEFVQMEVPAVITRRGQPQIPDSLLVGVPAIELPLAVLVDEHGRAILHELPWFPPANLPQGVVAAVVANLPQWRFSAARRSGRAERVWAAVQYTYRPVGAKSATH